MSSTGLGLQLSNKLKRKINICRELVCLCDEMMLDLNYRITPVIPLLEGKLCGKKNLSFIKVDNIRKSTMINSELNDEENRELGAFLYSLGKSDVSSQLKLIEGFRDYIDYSKNQYQQQYMKNSRVYISYGIFSGIVLCLILI